MLAVLVNFVYLLLINSYYYYYYVSVTDRIKSTIFCKHLSLVMVPI